MIRDTCKHKIKCTEKWQILYKCKNHINMEFIMQNNIQSKQMMCHPEPGSKFGRPGKKIAIYNLHLILMSCPIKQTRKEYSHLSLTISLRFTKLIDEEAAIFQESRKLIIFLLSVYCMIKYFLNASIN